MPESLCVRTLIESISGIKIEIKQPEQDKDKVVLKNRTKWLKPDFSGPFTKKCLNSLSYIANFNRTLFNHNANNMRSKQ